MITDAHLKILCDLTLELVRLRQNNCEHLIIENVAHEIFGRILGAYLNGLNE